MVDLDSNQHVLHACREHDVKFIRLWFTDILGILKSVAITVEELEHALDDGVSFDGGSIEGFARSGEADMRIMPDPATYCDHIRETYEELRTAVAAMDQPTPKKTRRKTTRRASGKAAKASPSQAS